LWFWASSGGLILLSMAVWRRFVKPEPTMEAVVGEPLTLRSG
jgi:hypothetical protein